MLRVLHPLHPERLNPDPISLKKESILGTLADLALVGGKADAASVLGLRAISRCICEIGIDEFDLFS